MDLTELGRVSQHTDAVFPPAPPPLNDEHPAWTDRVLFVASAPFLAHADTQQAQINLRFDTH